MLSDAELQRLCSEIERALTNACLTEVSEKFLFDSVRMPDITLAAYAAWLYTHLKLDEVHLLLALEYVDRYLKAAGPVLSLESAHRLLGTAVVLAHKFDCDYPHTERVYGRVVGVSTRELHFLQFAFLEKIQYRLMYPDKFGLVWVRSA